MWRAPVLDVDGLHVTYGGAVRALRGISLRVPDGAVVAVLGSNGAGKTTLLRTLPRTLGLHRARVDGSPVRLGHASLLRIDPGQSPLLGVVKVPEGRRI